MRSWSKAARSALKVFDASDVLVLLGLGLVGAGVWHWSPPGASVAVGVVVLWYAMPPRPPFIGGTK